MNNQWPVVESPSLQAIIWIVLSFFLPVSHGIHKQKNNQWLSTRSQWRLDIQCIHSSFSTFHAWLRCLNLVGKFNASPKYQMQARSKAKTMVFHQQNMIYEWVMFIHLHLPDLAVTQLLCEPRSPTWWRCFEVAPLTWTSAVKSQVKLVYLSLFWIEYTETLEFRIQCFVLYEIFNMFTKWWEFEWYSMTARNEMICILNWCPLNLHDSPVF